MKVDEKSLAIGLAMGLAAGVVWYVGSTRPVIQKLVAEKAEATGHSNKLEQENAQYKEAAEHWFAVANSQPQPAQDPAVSMLNAVRPGLGTVANTAVQAIQKYQTPKLSCPVGYLPNIDGTCHSETADGAPPPPCPAGSGATRVPGHEWRCQEFRTARIFPAYAGKSLDSCPDNFDAVIDATGAIQSCLARRIQ